MAIQGVLKEYQAVKAHGGVTDASPHRLIQMLFEAALEKLLGVVGNIERNEIEEKSRKFNVVISIIGTLQASLDLEKGGEIAANLDSLYEYMTKRLFDASAKNDIEAVKEVTQLLKEIKSAWDEIADEDATA